MNCPQCGNQIVSNDGTCSVCGYKSQTTSVLNPTSAVSVEPGPAVQPAPASAPVAPTQPVPAQTPAPAAPAAPAFNQTNNSKGSGAKVILVLLIVVALAIGGYFVYKKFIQKDETPANERFTVEDDLFKIKDPTGHNITIKDDDIWIKKVQLRYLRDESWNLNKNAKRITEEEVEAMDVTPTQKSALLKSIDYLTYIGYSQDGLISILEYEKFEHDDAVFAAENCKADWKEQALIAAKHFLATGGFSKTHLQEMLEFEGFSDEAVKYAMNNVNADYYEQAVYDACYYKYSSSAQYDKEEAKDYLEYKGYTQEESDFAINTVYELMK